MDQRPHIVVVEDEATQRQMLVDYLGKQNYRVSGADGGTALRRLIERELPSLVLLDIDKLRSVNTMFGYASGDQTLKAVADAVEHHSRPNDLACRWGGDQIILLLQNCTMNKAMAIADAIRQQIAGLAGEGAAPVTVSGGVAEVKEFERPGSVLARAEEGLRAAQDALLCRGKLTNFCSYGCYGFFTCKVCRHVLLCREQGGDCVAHALRMLNGVAADGEKVRRLTNRRVKKVRIQLRNLGFTIEQDMEFAFARFFGC